MKIFYKSCQFSHNCSNTLDTQIKAEEFHEKKSAGHITNPSDCNGRQTTKLSPQKFLAHDQILLPLTLVFN